VLGGGGGRGAAQVGVLIALFEAGVHAPTEVLGVSVGALNGAVIAGRPSLAGAQLLHRLWLSPQARGVLHVDWVSLLLGRLRGGAPSALPGANLERLIQHYVTMTGIDQFEELTVPLRVLATDIARGELREFGAGELSPALRASAALPAVFPPVVIDQVGYMDGGVIDNLPIARAALGGAGVIAISVMAPDRMDHSPMGWAELAGRVLQLSLHHRMLAEFATLPSRARVCVLCPVLPARVGWDMRSELVEWVIEASRLATLALLQREGLGLLDRAGVHPFEIGIV